jgi:GNAT superfamily N-acetyltransferase
MSIHYRRGVIDDSAAVFGAFYRSMVDFAQRNGYAAREGPDAPPPVEQAWPRRQGLFEHLAASADEFWVAEQQGEIVGYARSILREQVQELTELFVVPELQSTGIGGELFRRGFPERGARRRLIIATADPRALPLYLRAGLFPESPVAYLAHRPAAQPLASDLEFEELRPRTRQSELDRIDRQVLGFARPEDHAWLQTERKGFIARRGREVVGYGYHGKSSGPFAAALESDLPVLLAHGETMAAEEGRPEFGVDLPLASRLVVDHLLARGFRLDPFLAHFLSDSPGVRLANYVFPSPPFFT